MMENMKYNCFYEYKAESDYWNKRLSNLEIPCDGVFLVGNKPHRVRIIKIGKELRKDIPKRYREAISTEECWYLVCTFYGTS